MLSRQYTHPTPKATSGESTWQTHQHVRNIVHATNALRSEVCVTFLEDIDCAPKPVYEEKRCLLTRWQHMLFGASLNYDARAHDYTLPSARQALASKVHTTRSLDDMLWCSTCARTSHMCYACMRIRRLFCHAFHVCDDAHPQKVSRNTRRNHTPTQQSQRHDHRVCVAKFLFCVTSKSTAAALRGMAKWCGSHSWWDVVAHTLTLNLTQLRTQCQRTFLKGAPTAIRHHVFAYFQLWHLSMALYHVQHNQPIPQELRACLNACMRRKWITALKHRQRMPTQVARVCCGQEWDAWCMAALQQHGMVKRMVGAPVSWQALFGPLTKAEKTLDVRLLPPFMALPRTSTRQPGNMKTSLHSPPPPPVAWLYLPRVMEVLTSVVLQYEQDVWHDVHDTHMLNALAYPMDNIASSAPTWHHKVYHPDIASVTFKWFHHAMHYFECSSPLTLMLLLRRRRVSFFEYHAVQCRRQFQQYKRQHAHDSTPHHTINHHQPIMYIECYERMLITLWLWSVASWWRVCMR